MAENLFILCLVIGGAAILPFGARRFHIPSAALEILFGMILFNTVVSVKPEWFRFFKELGFIYLMFIAGMELDLRELMKNPKIGWYIIIPALSLVLTPIVFSLLGHPVYVGLSLSMISAGIAIPVLKELGLAKNEFGRHVIGITLAGELLSIIALTGLDIYHRYGVSFLSALQIVKLGGLLLLAAITLRMIYIVAWWNPFKVRKVMESEDPVEEGIRIAISIVFSGALLAYGAGVEPIIGSFLAGVIFSFVFRHRARFDEKINALGFGFFIPFFFIGVGADFDVSLLSSFGNIAMALAMVIVVFLTNTPAIILRHFLGLGLKESLLMALLLSAPLSMIVVAGTLGARMGLIDGIMKNILVLTALFASLLFTFIFRLMAGRLIARSASQ